MILKDLNNASVLSLPCGVSSPVEFPASTNTYGSNSPFEAEIYPESLASPPDSVFGEQPHGSSSPFMAPVYRILKTLSRPCAAQGARINTKTRTAILNK